MRSQFDDNGQGPDISEVVAQVSETFKRNMRRLGPIVALVLLAVVATLGFYQVGPGEVGIVRTWGAVTARTDAGLHFILPIVQQVDVVNVETIRRIEVGFRGDKVKSVEAQMLTGDENIVEAQMIIQYRISDPEKYLFRLKDPDDALHASAEVALRSVVGRTNIDDVITTGRGRVQTEARQLLQRLMDHYDSGLSVTEVKLQAVDPPDQVKEAFHDVVRAREEKEQLINQAKGYQEDVIPKAKGEARQIEREAEGYREQRVLRANGDAEKFKSILAEYSKAEQVTRRRLYLETMQRMLSKVEKKVVVDQAIGGSALPILPLTGQGAVPVKGGQ
ncbi:MAG TPA: FtsH protease activity modulator HflK [Polyangiaceae bacterium]